MNNTSSQAVDQRNHGLRRKEWILVQRAGPFAFRLNGNSLIVVGSELCDINIQSATVDKRHAVLCFDPSADCFTVKDLNTTHGTFLNNRKVSADKPEKLRNMDSLQFGNQVEFHVIEGSPSSAENEAHQRSETSAKTFAKESGRPRNDFGSADVGIGGGGGVCGSISSQVVQPASSIRGASLYGSRVSSPSTLDSGRGSSSAPSSPAKEMSPAPSAGIFSANRLLSSPIFSKKVTDTYCQSKQLPRASNNQGCFSLHRTSSNHRRDSLEGDVPVDNNAVSLSRSVDNMEHFKSAINGNDFNDIDIPNEIFDDGILIEDQNKSDSLDPSDSKTELYSRPRSSASVVAHAQDSHCPLTPTTTPLYGTPHWWPQEPDEDEDEDNHDSGLPSNQSTGDREGSRPQSLVDPDIGPLSLNSESNMSVDSDTSGERKKVPPMAFTIDLDDGPKRFGIGDSISKFAPRHKRNLSLTKPEEDTPVSKDNEKCSLKNQPSSSTPSVSKSKPAVSSGTRSNNNHVSKTSTSKSELSPIAKNSKASNPDNNATCETSIESVVESETKKTARNNSKPSTGLSTQSSKLTFGMERSKQKLRPSSVSANGKVPSSASKSHTNNATKPSIVDADKDVEDTSSETGTYTVDKDKPQPAVDKARQDIAKMLGVSTTLEDEEEDAAPKAPEWVREWAEQAAIQHKQMKDLGDTQLFLRETANVVSAMQNRVTRTLSNNSFHNSDSDDEATQSHSPVKMMNRSKRTVSAKPVPASPLRIREASVLSDSGYQVGYQSDSSNDGTRDYTNIGGVKMNKAFNIRRGRLGGVGYESDGCAITGLPRPRQGSSSQTTSRLSTVSARLAESSTNVGSSVPSPFIRNDGGRFSLRMPKSRVSLTNMQAPVTTTPVRSTPKATVPPNNTMSKTEGPSSRRSLQTPVSSSNGSTRKPPPGGRSNSTLTAKEVELANWRRRKSYDPMRAAAEARKKRECMSAIETTIDDITPTSLSKQSASMMSKSMSMSFHNGTDTPIKYPSEEEDMIYVVDEVDSSHSNSPIHIPMTHGHGSREDTGYYGVPPHPHSPIRPKNKLEALDSLVIATIHSLSNKVRTASRQLLEKMQQQHADDENGALLEEMVSQLKELEIASSNNSSPNKSPSRELSGTLKNLKKLEQVILVLDRVLCDDSGSDANN